MNTTLNTEISKITRLSKDHAVGLLKLKIKTVGDLLNYLPVRYSDEAESRNMSSVQHGENVTIYGVIKDLKIKRSFKGHIPMCEAKLVDNAGSIKLIWFHQAYIAKMYSEGDFVKVSGVVQEKSGTLSILNPNIQKSDALQAASQDNIFNIDEKVKWKGEIMPIYRETRGVSSNFLNHLVKRAVVEMRVLETVVDPIPENILKKLSLPTLAKSYLYLHLPNANLNVDTQKLILSARKRFAFQEIFFLQLDRQREKAIAKGSLAHDINIKNLLKEFKSKIESKYGFKFTYSQVSAIESILENLNKSEPMGRLLEGDVGSGKTLVAAAASYAVVHDTNRRESLYGNTKKRLQVAYMAPTEILAKQHFESFINYFSTFEKIGNEVSIALITGKSCYKYPCRVKSESHKTSEGHYYTPISKPQIKKEIERGDISIVLGTHALIQKSLSFHSLAFTIIDEQHRFGVKQRAALASKKSVERERMVANDIRNENSRRRNGKGGAVEMVAEKVELPHLLSMTATPIPRTLALTIFGDLDLTVIDEMPRNRKKIVTKLSLEKERESVYDEILKEIESGYQAYVICPRIDEADEEEVQASKVNLRSVESEVKGLKRYFDLIPNPSPKEKGSPSFGGATRAASGEVNIVGIHSKLKKEEKEKMMQDFAENKIQILVSTSVVEVGVNVPNATRMIIEGGERFGLSQLHQLRGRVGRGERESVCYIFTTNGNIAKGSEVTAKRLKALEEAKNGFELAERDMEERGIGSLSAGKQWGMSDIAMEAIKNIKLVEVAREEARKIVESDMNLEKLEHQRLKEILEEKDRVHME